MTEITVSTEERLREVAVGLFAARGYSGTSMADIAQGVGVSKASLYNYYAAKEEILLDLLDRSVRDWKEASRPALEGEGSHRERLRAHLEAAVEFARRRPHELATFRLAATQIGGELGRRVTALVEEHKREYLERLESFFAAAVAAGEVQGASPRELAATWNVLLDGVVINQLFAASGVRLDRELLGRFWELCWRGLAGVAEGGEA